MAKLFTRKLARPIQVPQELKTSGHYDPTDRAHGNLLSTQPQYSAPGTKVLIYRAQPKGVTTINPNDYVTLNRRWAESHCETCGVYEEEPFVVVKAYVPASQVADASNPGEYFFVGATPVDAKSVYEFDPESERGRRIAAAKKDNPAADRETERIRESAKTPEAKRRHKFEAAEWTHPNGHPRCKVCGDEENEDGMCDGVGKTAAPLRTQDTTRTYYHGIRFADESVARKVLAEGLRQIPHTFWTNEFTPQADAVYLTTRLGTALTYASGGGGHGDVDTVISYAEEKGLNKLYVAVVEGDALSSSITIDEDELDDLVTSMFEHADDPEGLDPEEVELLAQYERVGDENFASSLSDKQVHWILDNRGWNVAHQGPVAVSQILVWDAQNPMVIEQSVESGKPVGCSVMHPTKKTAASYLTPRRAVTNTVLETMLRSHLLSNRIMVAIAKDPRLAMVYAKYVNPGRWSGPYKALAEETLANRHWTALYYAEDVLHHKWDGPFKAIAEENIYSRFELMGGSCPYDQLRDAPEPTPKTSATQNRVWVKPNGEVLEVGEDQKLHHHNVALEEFPGGREEAVSSGWARGGTFTGIGYVEAYKLTREQLHAFQNLFSQVGGLTTFTVALDGGRGEFTPEEFFTANDAVDFRRGMVKTATPLGPMGASLFAKTASDQRIWLSQEGKVVPCNPGQEHVDATPRLVDFEPIQGQPLYTQVLDHGWIRIGAGMGQTWVSARSFTREGFANIQTFLLKNPGMLQKSITLEIENEDDEPVSYWSGTPDEFLSMQNQTELARVMRKASDGNPRGIISMKERSHVGSEESKTSRSTNLRAGLFRRGTPADDCVRPGNDRRTGGRKDAANQVPAFWTGTKVALVEAMSPSGFKETWGTDPVRLYAYNESKDLTVRLDAVQNDQGGLDWYIARVPGFADSKQRSSLPGFNKQASEDIGSGDHAMTTDESGQFWGDAGAGCVFVSEDSGRVLLALRSDYVNEPRTWGVWGGAIDGKENPATAATREVREETGYRGTLHLEQAYVFKKDGFTYTTFTAHVPTEFDPELNWETAGSLWCEPGVWPKPLHFGLKAAMPSIMDKLETTCPAK